DHWAKATPHATFMAQRGHDGEWIRLTYAETRTKARRIAAALLARGLSAERPLAILSGNDLEHMLLNMGAYYAGIPYAPISPAYSLLSKDFGKLKHIMATLTPGLVYVADGRLYDQAVAATICPETEVVAGRDPFAGPPFSIFDDLLADEDEAVV